MVLIAVGGLVLCCLWTFLALVTVLATIMRILCWSLGNFLSCVLPSDATDGHHVPVFQMVTDSLHNFYSFPCKHLYFTGHSYVQPSWRIVIYWLLLVWSLLLTCAWFLVPFPESFCFFCITSELGWLTACSSQEEGVPYISASQKDSFSVPFLLVAKSCIFWLPLTCDVIMF